jgi:hypothetical protein
MYFFFLSTTKVRLDFSNAKQRSVICAFLKTKDHVLSGIHSVDCVVILFVVQKRPLQGKYTN